MISREARHSTKSVEWYTPPDIIARVRETFGGPIGLDPSSCSEAQKVVGAHTYLTYEGLETSWYGDVYLNPPGGRGSNGWASSTLQWWDKLTIEYLAGRIRQAVFMGFSVEILQTGQSGEPGGRPTDYPVCIPSRRVRFLREAEEGEACISEPGSSALGLVQDKSPTHANAIVYLPPKPGTAEAVYRFARSFSSLGAIVAPYRI